MHTALPDSPDETRRVATSPAPAEWRRQSELDGCRCPRRRRGCARNRDQQHWKTCRSTQRRNLAEILVDDRVGSVATPALAALVRLDGTPSILAGLAGRSAAVRRAARDWASIRGVDARGFYLRRLASDPNDAIALTGLAELGNEPDEELFRSMLEDPCTRIRAAGLRGLARVDGIAARRAALQALTGALTGRITRTAANILRDGTLTAEEITAISRIALDHTRAASQRFRSLSLLRAAPWPHLSVLLEARAMTKDGKARRQLDVELRYWLASSGRISRGPDPALRERIERQLPNIEDRATPEDRVRAAHIGVIGR